LSLLILGQIFQLPIQQQLHIVLFCTSLALAYITTYSAVEVDSPSLIMVMNIAEASKEGLDKNKIQQIITDETLIKPRIKDLVEKGMIYLDVDKYKLTPRGLLLTRLFIFYRELLNTGKGG
jgi:predicted transcriptional regulator